MSVNWFRRWQRTDIPIDDLLNFDAAAYAETAIRGEVPVDIALSRLRDERKLIERRLRSLEKAQARLTSQRTRSIGRGGPALGPEIMRAELQMQNDANLDIGKSKAELTLQDQLEKIREATLHLQTL